MSNNERSPTSRKFSYGLKEDVAYEVSGGTQPSSGSDRATDSIGGLPLEKPRRVKIRAKISDD